MEKITFENTPSTNTPINATNLNLIQTNTENAIALIDGKIADSGWKNATLTASFQLYSSSSKCQYRKVGKLVQVRGTIKPTTALSANSSTIAFTLPDGYKPSDGLNFICQGSGKNTFLFSVATSGDVAIARYGTTGYSDIGTSAWLTFSIMFFVD